MPDLMRSSGEATEGDLGESSKQRRRPTVRSIVVGLILLAGAWVLPVAAMAVGAGWILPLLIWVGTASLLRSGRTILDRLVLAIGLLVGLVCAVGLVLSLWPATLEPVPVSGLALTSLVVAGLLARRRPEFPVNGMGVPELGVVGGTVVCAALVLRPFLGRDFADRLSILAIGGDLARHFTIYDTIRLVGGFLFLHRGESMPNVDAGYESYPQGSHFIYALLANVMPQGADRADPVASFDLLITFDIGTFVLMCLAILWAARWVAGPLLHGWVTLPFLGAVSGYLFFGEPITMLTRGFPSEMAGAALLAVLVAIVIRPTRRLREQCVLVSALVVGISFTYFLFLPFAIIAALVWVFLQRRKLWRRRVTVGVCALLCGALSLVSPIVNTLLSPASVGERLLLPGSINKVDRAVVLAWLFVALAAPLLRWSRRSRIWRAALVLIVVSTVPAAAMMAQHLFAGHTQDTYYLDKFFHEMLVVTVVAAGSILLLLAPAFEAFKGRRLVSLATAFALGGALFVTVTDLEYNGPAGSGRRHFQERNAIWAAGDATMQAVRLYPHPDGRLTWVQLNSRADLGNRDASHWATLYTSVLQRNYRESWSVFYWGYPWLATSETETAEFLMTSPKPYRVLVNDTVSMEIFSRIKARYPSLDLQIVDLRGKR
jgi:hypothetical protein